MTPEEYIKARIRGCSNELDFNSNQRWVTVEDALAAIEMARSEMKEKDESDDELYAIHLEKWDITGECPSELEAKIDAKFGITGRDSNGKPSNGYCDWKKDVFTNGPSIYSFVKLGMDYQKEQMMKDVIEGRVIGMGPLTDGNITDPQKKTRRLSATYSFENTPYCELGDKVKAIIIKE